MPNIQTLKNKKKIKIFGSYLRAENLQETTTTSHKLSKITSYTQRTRTNSKKSEKTYKKSTQ